MIEWPTDTSRIQHAVQAATDTRSVTIGSGVIAAVADVYRRVFFTRSAILIVDDDTFAVAGDDVQRRFKKVSGKGLYVGTHPRRIL